MIHTSTEYIQKHIKRHARFADVRIVVDEDYNHETDGFRVELIGSTWPLSIDLEMNREGESDLGDIVFTLGEQVKPKQLKPGTIYEIRLAECEEYDGAPILMTVWAIQHVHQQPFL